MITTLLAPTSTRPRLTISSSTCSSEISPPIAATTSRVASRPRTALSASSRRCSLRSYSARVVDRDRRPIGEDHGGLLVLLGELAAPLLGQVQVAPRLARESRSARPGSCASAGVPPGTRSSTGAGRRPRGATAVDDRSARRAPPGRVAARRSPGESHRRRPRSGTARAQSAARSRCPAPHSARR